MLPFNGGRLVREIEELNLPVPGIVWIRDFTGSNNEGGDPRAGAIALVGVVPGERSTSGEPRVAWSAFGLPSTTNNTTRARIEERCSVVARETESRVLRDFRRQLGRHCVGEWSEF